MVDQREVPQVRFRVRLCRKPGCTVRLSMFNLGKYCFTHQFIEQERLDEQENKYEYYQSARYHRLLKFRKAKKEKEAKLRANRKVNGSNNGKKRYAKRKVAKKKG